MVPHVLADPYHSNPRKMGRVPDAAGRYRLIMDQTVSMWSRVVGIGQRGWLPQSSADGLPSGSPRRPNVPWGHIWAPVMLKERYRLTGLSWQYHRCLYDLIHAETPTQGESITSTTTCPVPCAIIPHPGQPARRTYDSVSSMRPSSGPATAIAWKCSKSTI